MGDKRRLYVIDGMGRGFDGLVVEGNGIMGFDDALNVTRIINTQAIVGDRTVSFPVTPGSLDISFDRLRPYDEELREFDNQNPNGKYLGETRVRSGDLEAVIGEYERLTTVTVLEHDERGRDITRTRYTQSFTTEPGTLKAMVDAHVKEGDLDDLIFMLKELKHKELREANRG